MPSNTQPTMASGDGKVRCRIVHDDIPIDICSKEQNVEDCEGCRAPTRRCHACKKLRGIADAERGLCPACAADAGQVQRTAVFEGTPAHAITTVLDRVRSLAIGKKIEPREVSPETAEPDEIENAERLLHLICQHFNVGLLDLLKQDRHPQLALARHLAMYLLKSKFGFSFPAIGKLLGGRDHTTVMHGVQKIERDRGKDPAVKGTLEALEGKLQNHSERLDLQAALKELPRQDETNDVEAVLHQTFIEATKLLAGREAEILYLRYGLDGSPPITFEEVASRYGVSRQRAEQIEQVSFTKLRRHGIAAETIAELKRLSSLRRVHQTVSGQPGESEQSRKTVIRSSPHLDDPASLYRAIIEHANQQGSDAWIVSAPVPILMRRFHLLRDEAHQALSSLARQGYLEGELPWSSVTLLKQEGIEAAKALIANPRAQHTLELQKKASEKPREAAPSPVASVVFHPQPKPDHERKETKPLTIPLTVASLPSSKPLATYGEIYAHLQARSNEVRGERVVGGALPMLQIRFKLNPAQAKESLEQLEAKGCIQRKDEWRTIRLISPPTEGMDDGPARVASQTGITRKPPGKQPTVTQRQPTPQGTVERTTKIVAPAPAVGANWLSQSIALLEREIAPLRKKRDDLGQRIALLEAGLTLLKKAEADLTAAKDGADASIAEVVQLIRRLLSHLP